MEPQWIARFRSLLLESGLASPERIRGCTEAKVLQLSAGRAFPSAYRDWLRAFGARAGSFGRRRSMFWPAALEIQTGLQNVLEHHGIAFRPEPEMFIFGVEAIPGETPFHFHYRIDYFRRPEGDDPPVYRYDSEEGTTRRVQDSISGFLTGELERQIAGKISPTKE